MKVLIFKINYNSELSTRIQRLAFQYGYGWSGTPNYQPRTFELLSINFENNNNNNENYKTLSCFTNIPAGYKNEKDVFLRHGYSTEEIFLTDKISEVISFLKHGQIKPDYNTPKELVYENKDNKIKVILFRTENKESFKNLQYIGFQNDYYWLDVHDTIKERDTAFIIYVNMNGIKKIMCCDDECEHDKLISYLIRFFNINDDEIIFLEKLNELKSMLKHGQIKPDYNTSKELVYEHRNTIKEAEEIIIELEDMDDLNELEEICKKYYSDDEHILSDIKYERPYISSRPSVAFIKIKKVDMVDVYKKSNIMKNFGFEDEEGIEKHDILDGVYNKLFNLKAEKQTIIKILKQKKILIEPDYNTSKELVYESKGDDIIKKINNYDSVIIRCHTNEEIIDIQNILFSFGFTWLSGHRTPILKYTTENTKYLQIEITHDDNRYITKSTSDSTDEEIMHRYSNYLILNTKFDFYKFFLMHPDYNTPKELVYENKDNLIKVIIFKLDNKYSFKELQYIGFENDYYWLSCHDIIRDDDASFIMYVNLNGKKRLMWCDKEYDDYKVVSFHSNYFHINDDEIILLNNISNLKLILKYGKIKPDYNTPKELVYESNISNFKYRVKTEQEFLKEFGNNWRIDMLFSFPSNMDYLLGTEIDKSKILHLLEDNGNIKDGEKLKKSFKDFHFTTNSVSGYSWSISTDMIKKVIDKPDYNTPKELVYENKDNLNKTIVFKINQDPELSKEVQNIIFEYGYRWIGREIDNATPKYFEEMESIVLEKNKKITYFSRLPDGYIDEVDYLIAYEHHNKEDIILLKKISDLKSILQNGRIKPDYNTPKELIYEANENDNYNRIAIKVESNNDIRILSDIIKDNSPELDYTQLLNYTNMGYFPYVIYIAFRNFSEYDYGWDNIECVQRMLRTNDMYSNCYNKLFDIHNDKKVIINTIKNKEISLINKPDYNTPKQLVYEANENNKYDTIAIKVETYDNIKLLAKIIEENSDEIDSYDILDFINRDNTFPYVIYINFIDYFIGWDRMTTIESRINNGTLYMGFYEKIFDLNKESDINIIIQTVINKELKIQKKPDYNTPKELVYENKLLKFNTFKK